MCIIEIHNAMNYKINNLALVLFVLSTSIVLASTTNAFAAAPVQVEMEACLNDFNPPTNPCDTADEWKGSNIAQDATYPEGSSIPIRIAITGLDTTIVEHTLVIGYDMTKLQGGTINHVFDYITAYDFTDDSHPCLDPHNETSDSICAGWMHSESPTPEPMNFTTNGTNPMNAEQPTMSWSNINATKVQQVSLFAPPGTTFLEITEVSYLDEGDPSGESSNTEEAKVSIKFKTDSPNVILAYGMHIASPVDWINTAGSVSGQPVQAICIEFDGKGCGHLNFDSSVIVAFPDSILTLTKEVVNENFEVILKFN